MSTALYRRYLAETRELLDGMDEQDIQDADVLEVSSSVLCRLFEEHLPPGVELPEWCAPMTLHQYQNRSFEQPRSVLEGLIHPDKYTRARRPAIGDWTIAGDQVIIGIEPLGARRDPGRDPQLDTEPSGEHLGADCAEEGNTGQFPGADHAAAQALPLVLSAQGWQSANRRNSVVIKV